MQKVSETWPIPIFKGLTVFSFLISHWMRAHFFCLWLRMHKVNMSLGEKIMSSIQTASHGSFGKRTSEGAVPSTDYIPASLSRESFHGHLLQAQPCMTKKMSLSSLQYVAEYLLGMRRINFVFSIVSSGSGVFLACLIIWGFLWRRKSILLCGFELKSLEGCTVLWEQEFSMLKEK